MRPENSKERLLAAHPAQDDILFTESIYYKMIEEVEDYAILLLDTNGLVINWNKGAERIKGYTSEEVIGKSFRIFYTPDDQQNLLPEKVLSEALHKGKSVQEGWRVRKDGSMFWGSVVITSIHERDRSVIGFTKVTRDLTQQKKMEESMLNAIVDTQERERKEISDELHDNVNQRLATSKLFLERANEECKSDLLLRAEQNLMAAVNEIRNISHRISPNVIFNLGLPEAIDELTAGINQLNKLKAKFYCNNRDLQADPDVQLALYRITQEQVSNILKYADAKNVRIELSENEKQISIVITDDGRGFDFMKVKKGLGIQNIFFRAERCKGNAAFITAPGKGCTVKVNIPFKPPVQ
ncbi:MAG: PAS domain S-box protein [Chitinophagaceae bacterium]|nr:PAS domain S-box protein [Chitinophagaceae bacterium]